jgi:hypothetical protein
VHSMAATSVRARLDWTSLAAEFAIQHPRTVTSLVDEAVDTCVGKAALVAEQTAAVAVDEGLEIVPEALAMSSAAAVEAVVVSVAGTAVRNSGSTVVASSPKLAAPPSSNLQLASTSSPQSTA